MKKFIFLILLFSLFSCWYVNEEEIRSEQESIDIDTFLSTPEPPPEEINSGAIKYESEALKEREENEIQSLNWEITSPLTKTVIENGREENNREKEAQKQRVQDIIREKLKSKLESLDSIETSQREEVYERILDTLNSKLSNNNTSQQNTILLEMVRDIVIEKQKSLK